MIRFITQIAFALLLGIPLSIHAQEQQERFVVFIHSGPRSLGDPLVQKIATSLAQKGFIVREPDNLQSEGGYPRVDYFSKTAFDAARQVASVVNYEKQSSGQISATDKLLTPQFQSTTSFSETYLSVWLF
jgi:hypothetical protein